MFATLNIVFALLAMLGIALGQGVTAVIAPDGAYPAGCNKNVDGQMEITVITLDPLAKRYNLMPQRRAECAGDGTLVMTLQDGVLKDALGRTGYIADNYQFQFDNPPQAGALSTAGYCLFDNKTLALGPTTTFYRCESSNFYNLYDRKYASYCDPVQIIAMPCGASAPEASQLADGTIVGTEVVQTTVVRPFIDGQPEVFVTVAPVPMCQIGDGQLQEHATPCPFVGGVPTAAAPVSQITDGQVEVPAPGPANAVTQLPDGQPNFPAQGPGNAVTQLPDGQPNFPAQGPGNAGPGNAGPGNAGPGNAGSGNAGSGNAVTQLPDGQPNFPAAAPGGNSTLGSPQPKPTQYGTSEGDHNVGSLIAMLASALGLVAML